VEELLPLKPKRTFEIIYNEACLSLAAGRLDSAQKLLQEALDSCKETLKGEDYSDAEIETETIPILTQMGYVWSLMGNQEKAREVFELVSKSKYEF
jgi:signal recognition particle subunit SRP72